MSDDTANSSTISDGEQSTFDSRRAQHQGHVTDTWHDQHDVEEDVCLIRKSNEEAPDAPLLLLRDKHISWLIRNVQGINGGYQAFDSLQAWVCFWIIHSLNLLGATIPEHDADSFVSHITSFFDPRRGAFGGGPCQTAHLASTFAAVMALCSIGSERALEVIDVKAISRFLHDIKQPDGSFRVSENGEADARAVYCALATASILGISHPQKPAPNPLFDNINEYIASLQTFDGGLSGDPGAEAHGGNTYCALAALVLTNRSPLIDCEALLDWAVMRQMPFEGGFQGRTNKLVDSCYSFWVGSCFPLLAVYTKRQPIADLFEADALQRYILECCQLPNGGFRDKPGMARDLMHTCYALSGLSVAQHYGDAAIAHDDNRVHRVNVVYNLREDKLQNALQYFDKRSAVV